MTFEDWSARQFGPRPTSINVARLIEQARELEEEARRIRSLIAQAYEWEAKVSGARVAWTAARGKP